jgi:hypothetical protein
MSDNTAAHMRKERIERLLHELQYELVRGLSEHEIEEEMHWNYVFPICRSIPGGCVVMQFRMRPMPAYSVPMTFGYETPRLRLVGQNDT